MEHSLIISPIGTVQKAAMHPTHLLIMVTIACDKTIYQAYGYIMIAIILESSFLTLIFKTSDAATR